MNITAKIRVWCIGGDGTEYYAAHSLEELGQFYLDLVGWQQLLEDVSSGFRELSKAQLDAKFDFSEEDGTVRRTSFRKLAKDAKLPNQLSTGYN